MTSIAARPNSAPPSNRGKPAIGGILLALAFVTVMPVAAETTKPDTSKAQRVPGGVPPALPRGAFTPPSGPSDWICYWSSQLKGTEIKSFTVKGGAYEIDATICDVKSCAKACADTPGCIAAQVTKPWEIDGQKNVDSHGDAQCVCTLYSSVSGMSYFAEIRFPRLGHYSGMACMPRAKLEPRIDRYDPSELLPKPPPLERDRWRPPTPDPGRRR